MSGRNVNLTPHLSDFVDGEVASGRHQSASEVVREALRRYAEDLAAEQASLEAIAAVARRGAAAIRAGRYRMVEGEDDFAALEEALNRRAAAAAARG